MQPEFQSQVRRALEIVAGADGDHARERNGVGFSKHDAAVGHSLVDTLFWTEKQLALAHRLAMKYHRQHGIVLPAEVPQPLSKPVISPLAVSDAPEWGVEWSAPRTLNTKGGIRILRTGSPTQAFWAEWKRDKEGMRARGYSVSPGSSGWEVQHWASPAQAPEEAKAVTTVLIPPVDARRLREWQAPAVRECVRALATHGAALNGSDTGTGKTYMACATIQAMQSSPLKRPGKWLVLTPKSVRPDFERVARFFGIQSSVAVAGYEKVRNGNTEWGTWVQTVHGGRTYKHFQWSDRVAGLVFDEAHRCKGTKTQNAQMMIGAKHQRIPTLAMSATAVESPMDMKALGYLLGLHNLRDFYDWAAAHGCFQNRWDGWEFGGSSMVMDDIRKQVWPEHGARIRIADLGDKFPKTVITTKLIEVPDPEAVRKAWAELAIKLDEIEEKAKNDSTGAEHLTRMLRARQTVEIQKVPAIIEIAEESMDDGKRVVIGVNFRETLDSIRSALEKAGRKVGVIHGDITGQERQGVIDRFKANLLDAVIVVLQAGGEGVSLHGEDRVSILSPPWAARLAKQFWGRIHRDGGGHTTQYVLYAAGTVEENVAERMQAKLDRMQAFNDGLPEVEDKDLAA